MTKKDQSQILVMYFRTMGKFPDFFVESYFVSPVFHHGQFSRFNLILTNSCLKKMINGHNACSMEKFDVIT